jgi:hypothetical protein
VIRIVLPDAIRFNDPKPSCKLFPLGAFEQDSDPRLNARELDRIGHPQDRDSHVQLRRKTKHVGEVQIERDENSCFVPARLSGYRRSRLEVPALRP